MTTFQIHTVETAPEEVKEVFETVQKDNNGYIPNLIGLLANAPTALEAYRTVGAINRRNSLTPVEREVVQITAAVTNGCAFCVAGHTAFSIKQIQMNDDLLQALRNRTPIETDPKLDTLAKFTLAAVSYTHLDVYKRPLLLTSCDLGWETDCQPWGCSCQSEV